MQGGFGSNIMLGITKRNEKDDYSNTPITVGDTITFSAYYKINDLNSVYHDWYNTLTDNIGESTTVSVKTDSFTPDVSSVTYTYTATDSDADLQSISFYVAGSDAMGNNITSMPITLQAVRPAISGVKSTKIEYNKDDDTVTFDFSFTGVNGAATYKLLKSSDESELASNTVSPITYIATANTTLSYYIVAYNAAGRQLTAYQNPALSLTTACLPRGTRVLTPTGLRLVEDIANGDLVLTDDERAVPVKVHISNTVCSDAKTAPVQIAARSFFGEYPVAPIRVSSWHAFKVGPGNAWLIPKDVLGVDGVVQEPFGNAVDYYHLELPDYLRDNLVLEGGAVVESYGVPWKTAAGLWGKTTYNMDKGTGYCRRIE